jgi:CheY-like chemotaxis protein
MPIDPDLLEAIAQGDCVAFVGAGFSAAADLPQWEALIRHVADDLHHEDPQAPQASVVRALLDSKAAASNRELEMAAQLLHDAFGPARFSRSLTQALRRDALPLIMQQRLKHLLGIPFRAIVTTNFDLLLGGTPPSGAIYQALLRGPRPSPWREAVIRVALSQQLVEDLPGAAESVVVQLHGRVDDPRSLVLTRSQYRQRLYADPAYLTVLRSLLATSTVLFLGYSLTDAYLNELRSELVEAMSEPSADTSGNGAAAKRFVGKPLAWAVLANVSEVARDYYRAHEGLAVLPYQAEDGDHSGFDRILARLYEETNPIHRLGLRISDRRLLWMDPEPDNNALGRELLRTAVKDCRADNQCFEGRLIEVEALEQALALLADPNEVFDLVISHWGHDPVTGIANGARLLQAVAARRAAGHEIGPAVIFSAGRDNQAENRRSALRLGAVAYVTRWEDLMETLERYLPRQDSPT